MTIETIVVLVIFVTSFFVGREVGLRRGDHLRQILVDEMIRVINEEVSPEVRKRMSNSIRTRLD